MSDAVMRALERAAEQGDPGALAALRVAWARAGRPVDERPVDERTIVSRLSALRGTAGSPVVQLQGTRLQHGNAIIQIGYRGVTEWSTFGPSEPLAIRIEFGRRFIAELDRLDATGVVMARWCCPRRVGRDRCRAGTSRGHQCLCREAWSDHPRLLRTERGTLFLSQPGGSVERIERGMVGLRAWADARGVNVELSPERSWHYPGRTSLILVSRQ